MATRAAIRTSAWVRPSRHEAYSLASSSPSSSSTYASSPTVSRRSIASWLLILKPDQQAPRGVSSRADERGGTGGGIQARGEQVWRALARGRNVGRPPWSHADPELAIAIVVLPEARADLSWQAAVQLGAVVIVGAAATVAVALRLGDGVPTAPDGWSVARAALVAAYTFGGAYTWARRRSGLFGPKLAVMGLL